MTRVCNACNREQVIDAFRFVRARYQSGYYTSRTCRNCVNARDWQRKKERMATDAEYLARVKQQHGRNVSRWYANAANRTAHNLRTSQRSWAVGCCDRLPRPLPDRMVLYVTPNMTRMGPIRRQDRPWTLYHMVYREERPGMVPPAHAIPVARVTTTRAHWQDEPIVVVSAHSSCHDDWRWTVKYIDLWMRRS